MKQKTNLSISKVAIILHGLSSGKNDKDEIVSIKESLKSLYDNIIDKYECDIFFHTWGYYNDFLINFLKPKSYRFEDPIKTKYIGTKVHSTLSRFTSLDRSVELFLKTCDKDKLNYDAILLTRFDLIYFKNIFPKKINSNDIFFPAWSNPISGKEGLLDLYWITGNSSIRNFSETTNFIKQYMKENKIISDKHKLFSNHFFIFKFILSKNLNLKYFAEEYRYFCISKHYQRLIRISDKPHYFFSKQQVLYYLAKLKLEYPLKNIYNRILNFLKF